MLLIYHFDYKNPKMLVGQTITLGTFFFIATIIIAISIYSKINKYRENPDYKEKSLYELFQIWLTDMNEHFFAKFRKNYKEIFMDALINAKLMLIFLLGFITIIYQYTYTEKNDNTYLGLSSYQWKVLLDIILESLAGMISSIIVMISRKKNVLHNFPNIIVIGLILGLFSLTEEASGFNRYISANFNDTRNPYYNIDIVSVANSLNVSVDTVANILVTAENGGDPFILSWATLAALIVAMILASFFLHMITATYFGYKDRQTNQNATNQKQRIPFIAELIIIGVINFISSLMGSFIRMGQIILSEAGIAIAMAIAAVALQIMFEYTGLLDHNRYDEDNTINNAPDVVIPYSNPNSNPIDTIVPEKPQQCVINNEPEVVVSEPIPTITPEKPKLCIIKNPIINYIPSSSAAIPKE